MFYSQYGQDEYVYRHWLKEIKSGFFVDIGAHDGVSLSNSRFFEELGWTGVCVEPNPSVYEKLVINRNCECVNAALSERGGILPFYKIEGNEEMLSGLADEYHEKHMKRIEKNLKRDGGRAEVINVKAITFMELPKVEEGMSIDYLSIDTEGNELKILQIIPFEKIKIKVISVENNYKDKAIEKLLKGFGFERVKKLKCDEIYINKSNF